MDEETKKAWEKSKRIDAEKMKAARNLANHKEDKTNLAHMPITKPHGFSKDPDAFVTSAERLANISIIFALLGIVFGIFMDILAVVVDVNSLGMAGAAIMIAFGAIHGIGIGIGLFAGVFALIFTVIFALKTKRKVHHIIITAASSLILMALYYIVSLYV